MRGQPADQLQPLPIRCGRQLLIGDRVLAVALLGAGGDSLVGRARGVRIDVVVERDRAGTAAARAARRQPGCGEHGTDKNRHALPDTIGLSPHLPSKAERRLEWLPDRQDRGSARPGGRELPRWGISIAKSCLSGRTHSPRSKVRGAKRSGPGASMAEPPMLTLLT